MVQEGDAICILTSHSLLPCALVAPAKHSTSCFVCIWGPPGQCLVIIPGDVLETMQCWEQTGPSTTRQCPQPIKSSFCPSEGAPLLVLLGSLCNSCGYSVAQNQFLTQPWSFSTAHNTLRVQNFVLFSGYTQQCSGFTPCLHHSWWGLGDYKRCGELNPGLPQSRQALDLLYYLFSPSELKCQ